MHSRPLMMVTISRRVNRLGGCPATLEGNLSTALPGQICRNATVWPETTAKPRKVTCDTWSKPFMGHRMHYLFIILAVVLTLAAHGCAPATDRLPPDSVLDPRGT